jgi:predicted thioesterase
MRKHDEETKTEADGQSGGAEGDGAIMKALEIGQTAEVEITVTPDMMARFDGRLVHELYSTASLVHHMEWAARKLIVPYLEPHEEAMGYNVEVSHLSMTLPDSKVRIRATLSAIRDRKIVCDIEAFNSRGKVARGTITQALIERDWLGRKMKELSIINQLSGQLETASGSK